MKCIPRFVDDILFINRITSFRDKLILTRPMVLKSAAGYYIGQLCIEDNDDEDIIEPYNRMSGYFPNREIAEQSLEEDNY